MKVNEIIKETTASDPNAAFKVTKQNPDGSIELADPAGTKINIPREKQAELKQDPSNPNQLTLDPNALAKAGTPSATSGPPIGSTVNVASTIPGQITPTTGTMGEEDTAMSENFDEVTPKFAKYILRKVDVGYDILDLIQDHSDLEKMYYDVARIHNLDPKNEFEKIEQVVINDLNNIADDEDDEYDELDEIARLSGL